MSFTLMRYKDGKPAPIKMSIWDAFKGVPPPKPRPHKCPSCNSFHRPGTEDVAAPEAQPEGGADKSKEEEEKPDKPADADNGGFTAEEDAKIVEFKADGKTWAQIAQELGGGRVKNDISRRHKQLSAGQKEEKVGDEGDDKKIEEKDKDERKKEKEDDKTPVKMSKKDKKKAAKAEKDREEGLKRREEEGKAKAAEEPKEPAAEPQPVKPAADNTPSQPSATYAKPPEVKNNKQKWIEAASNHFDRTGQRITPEQARKMAEENST